MLSLCVPEQVELPSNHVGSPSLELFKRCLDVAPEIQRENFSKVNIDADYKFQARCVYSSPLHQIPRQNFLRNTSKPTTLRADSEDTAVNSGIFSKHCAYKIWQHIHWSN